MDFDFGFVCIVAIGCGSDGGGCTTDSDRVVDFNDFFFGFDVIFCGVFVVVAGFVLNMFDLLDDRGDFGDFGDLGFVFVLVELVDGLVGLGLSFLMGLSHGEMNMALRCRETKPCSSDPTQRTTPGREPW